MATIKSFARAEALPLKVALTKDVTKVKLGLWTEKTVEETAEEVSEEAAEEGTEKKSLFGKKKKDKKDEQIEELTDRLKRQMAEFDNYRKRTEKEKSAMYEIGAKDVVENGKNGFIVSFKDYDAIVSTIERLFSDNTLFESLSAFARERVVGEYSENRYYERLIDIVKSEIDKDLSL